MGQLFTLALGIFGSDSYKFQLVLAYLHIYRTHHIVVCAKIKRLIQFIHVEVLATMRIIRVKERTIHNSFPIVGVLQNSTQAYAPLSARESEFVQIIEETTEVTF